MKPHTQNKKETKQKKDKKNRLANNELKTLIYNIGIPVTPGCIVAALDVRTRSRTPAGRHDQEQDAIVLDRRATACVHMYE